MKCEPSEKGVVLTPESLLEASALGRWAPMAPAAIWTSEGRRCLAIEFREPTPPPEPEPWRPEVGDWVRDKPNRGVLARVVEFIRPDTFVVEHHDAPMRVARRPGELEPWTPRVGERVQVKGAPSEQYRGGVVIQEPISVRWTSSENVVVRVRYDNGSQGLPDVANIEPAPPTPETEPPRRAVRVPAPGQRVRIAMLPLIAPSWVLHGTVDSVRADAYGVWVWVRGDGDSSKTSVAYEPDKVTPVGDDPRWIEITPPGDEP